MLYRHIESIRSAFQAVSSNGFRSALTIVSIMIGVASIITVVALLSGFSGQLTEQFKGLGTNTLNVTPYTPFKEALQGIRAQLTPRDLDAIKHKVEGVGHLTPLLNVSRQFNSEVTFNGETTLTQIYGTTSDYAKLYDSYPRVGRFLNRTDGASRRPVTVIGADVVEDLNLPVDPIGQFIKIGEQWLKVVGVLENRGELLGISQDNFVLLPYEFALSLSGEGVTTGIDNIMMKVSDIYRIENVKLSIAKVLRKEHELARDVDDDFKINTPKQLMESVTSITDMLTNVLLGVVSVSLIVGGIGIMNIMLVSVVERTKEIGICKSIGATRQDILVQFLAESLLLSLLGGIFGVALGYGIAKAVITLVPIFSQIVIPLWSVILAVGSSSAIGVLFGIIPSAKAANLHPIDALRHE